jgi:hypothetical protein
MKSLVTVAVYFGVQAVLLAVLASWAFGSACDIGDRRPSSTEETLVTIQGKLICDMGTQNNGQPCALRIEEDGTGRVFVLSGSDSLMRLYFVDGARRATVEGQRSGDSNGITVKRATAL